MLQVLVAGGRAEGGRARLVGADDEVGRAVKRVPTQVPLVHLTQTQNTTNITEKLKL